MLALGAWSIDLVLRQNHQQQLAAVVLKTRQLDRTLGRLRDRHERTVRRAREALLDVPTNQVALLSSAADHYVQEMERTVADLTHQLTTPPINTQPRFAAELTRLSRQVETVFQTAQDLAGVLDALLMAIEEGDVDAAHTAQQDLDRVDRAVVTALNTATRMLAISSAAHFDWLTHNAPAPPVWFPLVATGVVPLALWLSLRPLHRLRRLAQGERIHAGSREERQLATRFDTLTSERVAAEAGLGERTRELERAQQQVRRAEQDLALLRLYNENLVNNLRSAIVVTDAAGVVTSLNRAADKLAGSDAVLLGQPVTGCALGQALTSRGLDVAAELGRVLENRETLRFEALPVPQPGGERLVDLAIVPYLDEVGAPRGWLWVADDVTEALRVKRQLLATERLAAVGNLSAQVAHEIRNPLSAIGLNAELLEDEFAGSLEEPKRSEAATLLRAIAKEIERLTEITESYLKLARLPHPELRRLDVNTLVSDLVAMLGEELKAHQVELVLELATPAPVVVSDPGQLRQALLNIVRNSREAMPDGGTLTIRTRSTPDGCHLWIADTGPGIPPAILPRVFEPFFTTKKEGTGLGLSLAKQILTEHGGKLNIANLPQGGAQATVTLPSATGGGAETYLHGDDELLTSSI